MGEEDAQVRFGCTGTDRMHSNEWSWGYPVKDEGHWG